LIPELFDDERLRKLLLSSPNTAIEILQVNYQRRLQRVAVFFTKDWTTAADVVEEAFVDLWRNRHKLEIRHRGTVLQYITRIVKFKAITQFKSRIKAAETNSEYIRASGDSEKSIETQMIESELRDEILQLIDSFPAKEKQCLLMKLTEDLSTWEIAQRTGVSIKAVQRSLTSGIKRLRKYWSGKK
jgi:RNA polymerase sigma-70 factor (ECF subfamily)